MPKQEFQKEKLSLTKRIAMAAVPVVVGLGIAAQTLFGLSDKDTSKAMEKGPPNSGKSAALSGEAPQEPEMKAASAPQASSAAPQAQEQDEDSKPYKSPAFKPLTPEQLQKPVVTEHYDLGGNLVKETQVIVRDRVEELRQGLEDRTIQLEDGTKIAPVFYVRVTEENEVVDYESALGSMTLPMGMRDVTYREASLQEALEMNPNILNDETIKERLNQWHSKNSGDQTYADKYILNIGAGADYGTVQYAVGIPGSIEDVCNEDGHDMASSAPTLRVNGRPATFDERLTIETNKERAAAGMDPFPLVEPPAPQGVTAICAVPALTPNGQ